MTGKDLRTIYQQACKAQRRVNILSALVDSMTGRKLEATWARQDQDLMYYFHNLGAFSLLPEYKLDNTGNEKTACFYPRLGRAGKIKTNTSLLGREIGLNIKDPVMGRWFTLAHEYSHQEQFSQRWGEGIETRLGPGQFSEDLSQWSFLPLNGSGAGNIISEAFADVYAIMVLWQAWDRNCLEQKPLLSMIEQLKKSRDRQQREEDRTFQEQVIEADIDNLDEVYHIHKTGWAIEQVHRTREKWIGMNFDQLRQYAMDLAVQTWKEHTRIDFKGQRDFPLGVALRVYSLPHDHDKVLDTLVKVMVDSINEYANPNLIACDLKLWPQHYAKIGELILNDLRMEVKRKGPATKIQASWTDLLEQDRTGKLQDARREIREQWKHARTRIYNEITSGEAKHVINQYPGLGVLFRRHQHLARGHKPEFMQDRSEFGPLKKPVKSGTMTP